MACPFFCPTERAENIAFPHPSRLPLGGAWRGSCGAPGNELVQLGLVELESCNVGYAHACPRLPKESTADAVRFGVSKRSPERLSVQFVLESQHLPVEHGSLEFDRVASSWTARHPDQKIQKLADCFVQSFLSRNGY